jgi:F0F1-type ATP synthase assembly protein I
MPNNNKDLLKYMGMATQMMLGISVFTYIGFRLDKYWRLPYIGTIVLPLLFLTAIFYKILKDTNSKK